MKKQKKRLILFSLLVGLLVLSVLPMSLFGAKVEAAESTLPTVSVGGGVHYGVALGSYPVWRHNDGTWQNGHRPDGPFTITHPYTFTFPGWIVKSVQITPFASGGAPKAIPGLPDGMTPKSIFQGSRGYAWEDVQNHVGTNYSVSMSGLTGIDTSTISFNLTTTGVLTAPEPIPLHLNPDGTRREELLPNVVGYEYYFPVLIRLELIREGTAYIRHYTTDGKSLSGVFNDRDETLIHGQTYNFTAPTHPEYRYVGYKKRQDAPPESGPNWTSGTGPGSFKYDSSQFTKYYVFFYYEPAETVLPNLVAIDIVNLEPIEVGKPIKFKFIYENENVDITDSFYVTVWDDEGNILANERKHGMKKDERAELIFYYTFKDTREVTLTGYVDSGGRIPPVQMTSSWEEK
jgi:hypothetical protein